MSSQIFTEKIKTTDSHSLIVRYYAGVKEASLRLLGQSATSGFAPDFDYPQLTDTWEEFFDVARAGWDPLGSHAGRRITLLDLMKNPGTRTTKTTASLLMVARAVHHIDLTGDSVMIFTPSSGNKANALRDAVARALELELATPDKLRIVTLTPSSTLYKFRRSILTDDAELRSRNPILVYDGPEAGDVKQIGTDFAQASAGRDERVWYSLDIGNYKVADACRAFYEREFADPEPGKRRLHAHAVSSAYGLLGYQHGLNTMADLGIPYHQPGFLLVQHLATSDMVRHHLQAKTGELPRLNWKLNDTDGIFEQYESAHFPQATWETQENLEPTFYTHNPPTAPEMTSLIARHGGSGIVVSLLECVRRYGEVRRLVNAGAQSLPVDPRQLGEWSLVMGMTGVLNGLERGLADGFDEVVLHGSGMYLADAKGSPDRSQVTTVRNAADVAAAVY
ncbi:DUF6002 family protein [Streptomyces roseochromogenus]|uniref:Uncharacterized protein n=1 Tax=Streptomyces roseochromogenus subsp. oscitans DS 12.976 TaxID=1352936 RepID=V6KQQ1_STRRC|nr:DUF6002 family protein [Streptomyces roseochromogenus]EST33751.1 hypothetical protein M878_11945 [Streptomyces roseochromogenus subsp. oscitans DS 12.976]